MHKIGVLSGTFDPVHIGHIESALVARGALGLEKVLFFIEKSPLAKNGVADYKKRFTMLELATEQFPTLIPTKTRYEHITTKNTLAFLGKNYADYTPVLIIGSDMLEKIETWEDFETLSKKFEIAVVLRNLKEQKKIEKLSKKMHDKHSSLTIHILPPVWSEASSSKVKEDIKKNKTSELIHKDVLHYILKNKLYG